MDSHSWGAAKGHTWEEASDNWVWRGVSQAQVPLKTRLVPAHLPQSAVGTTYTYDIVPLSPQAYVAESLYIKSL